MADLNVFSAILRDNSQQLELASVLSWQARDASGSFTLLARHCRFLTLTDAGLSRFTLHAPDNHASTHNSNAANPANPLYMACTPALVEFADNQLLISTRRFFVNPDARLIQEQLANWLESEQERRSRHHSHVHTLENELVRKLNLAMQT